MRLYVAKIRELQMIEREQMFKMLDRDRRIKVSALRNEKEQERSIFAGLLFRYAFLQAGYDDKAWQQIEIGKGAYGKPYVVGYPEFHFGLSHSGEWVACATDCDPVGIDIQEMRPWKMTLAKRFYHKEEYHRLLALEGTVQDRQTKEFYSIWTAKESAVKLNGRGIGAGISQYVTVGDYSCIYDLSDQGKGQMFHTRQYDILQGYMLCVCSTTDVFPDLPEQIDV